MMANLGELERWGRASWENWLPWRDAWLARRTTLPLPIARPHHIREVFMEGHPTPQLPAHCNPGFLEHWQAGRARGAHFPSREAHLGSTSAAEGGPQPGGGGPVQAAEAEVRGSGGRFENEVSGGSLVVSGETSHCQSVLA